MGRGCQSFPNVVLGVKHCISSLTLSEKSKCIVSVIQVRKKPSNSTTVLLLSSSIPLIILNSVQWKKKSPKGLKALGMNNLVQI